MVPLLLLSGVFAGLSTGIPMMPTGMELPADECCESKDVGGVGYSLVGRMNTKDYNCLNDCIYVQDEEPSVKFCFASGDLEVECTEDETYEGTKSPPMEGSEMPPMEGSEMPPMEGSEMPPMEGSEMPPMEGSEMPPMEGSEMPPMEGSERPPMEGTVQPGGPVVTAAPSPSGSTIANPGGAATELTLSISQTWSQEPAGYERTAKVAVPATSAGQKIPVVLHLHGNGGQGNTAVLSRWLGDDCVIVSADGYERSWNIFAEKSKADDVSFLVDLLAKVGAEVLAADMNDVNIIGTSNGAAMTYRLIIETGADRPFRRVFPMVSSLISPQYHDGAFWASPELSADGVNNVYDTAVVPEFAANFEYAHFHGTDDGTIKYEGQVPGPNFLSGADVLAAQETDFLWAQAMGYTGSQLPDGDGVSVGTSALPVQSYTYLDGKVRHFKLIDEGHGTGPGHAVVQEIVRAAILG